jgi:lipopolysaccharide transport system ATP-binding protein
MSDTIITVENLSKSYLVGHKSGRHGGYRYVALRDVLVRGVRNAVRRTIDMARGHQVLPGDEIEEFWALKDVSFEVRRGEVLGIIGRNGAGKSTLLKILSRITEPTEGRVTLRGRVASLLEVGTGFHPELTGRENIYLNGTILGMNRRFITAKFDEIVAFAEIEKFLDTPVKHYSSGMYVRLAFAVAAHLEPEILIVDEVLAVGDAEFQKKCLGKMDDVSRREGRTVLFVSHNIAAITALTGTCLLLDKGHIAEWGDSETVSTKYLATAIDARDKAFRSDNLDAFRRSSIEDPPAKILKITICTPHEEEPHILPRIPFGSRLAFAVQIEVYRTMCESDWGIGISNGKGERVTELVCSDYVLRPSFEPGRYTLSANVANLFLSPGYYSLGAWLVPTRNTDFCDVIYDYPAFTIVSGAPTDGREPSHPWGAVFCSSVEWAVSNQWNAEGCTSVPRWKSSPH